MIPIGFKNSENEGLRILALGAHCDDIEIGCGGTLLKLIEEGSVEEIKWVVFASNELRKKEAILSAESFLKDVNRKEIVILDFSDAFLEKHKFEIKNTFETFKSFEPEIIFTHYRDDRHQDHRLLSDLAWNTFRNHLILEYEIPKYDGDLGQPNFYVELTENLAQKKVDFILESFASQRDKHWFDRELFNSLMRIRAMESANTASFSEAFYVRKMVY